MDEEHINHIKASNQIMDRTVLPMDQWLVYIGLERDCYINQVLPNLQTGTVSGK